jgi:hypothetical protein
MKAEVSNHSQDAMQKLVCQLSRKLIVGRLRANSEQSAPDIRRIEYPVVIQKILSHLNTKNDEVVELLPPQSRVPPQISLFK